MTKPPVVGGGLVGTSSAGGTSESTTPADHFASSWRVDFIETPAARRFHFDRRRRRATAAPADPWDYAEAVRHG